MLLPILHRGTAVHGGTAPAQNSKFGQLEYPMPCRKVTFWYRHSKIFRGPVPQLSHSMHGTIMLDQAIYFLHACRARSHPHMRQGRTSSVDELSQYNQGCLNSDTVTDRKAWTHGRAIPPDIGGSFCTRCHLYYKIVIIGFQIRATVVNPSCHLDWFGKWLSRACLFTVLGGVPGTAGRTVLVSRLVLPLLTGFALEKWDIG